MKDFKRLPRVGLLLLASARFEKLGEGTKEGTYGERKNKEAEKLLKVLPQNSFKIALNLKGEMLDSPGLAKKINQVFAYHNSHIVFIIGGSLGLGDELLKKMDYHLCFSKMTFPHQLMQVILLEQVYRAFKINNNETYHK